MSLFLVTPPAVEPITLDEAKDQIRVTSDDENGLIAGLIAAAREDAENYTHRALMTQTWDLKLDAFPCGDVDLPMPPLQSVTSVTYVDTAGVTQTLSTSVYAVEAPTGPKAAPGRLTLKYQQLWPQTQAIANAVTVRFVAGYGTRPESVPAVMRLLMKKWIAEDWAKRETSVIGNIVTPLPRGDDRLWPYKTF